MIEKIETKRLIIRKFVIEDAEDMYKNWATKKECNKYLPWKLHNNIDETKEIITDWINDYYMDKPKKLNYAIELKNNNEVIGSIAILHIKYLEKICEIGYCLGSDYWNNGYMTEVLKEIIKYLFNKQEFHLIIAGFMSENVASGRVMEKAGMKKEAVLRERALNQYTNEYDDEVIYSITKDEIKD